jgi:hypothetical protein
MAFGASLNFNNTPMETIHLSGRLIVHQKLFILLLIGSLILPANSEAAGPWKGRVIDQETKKPIEGAVVLMVWYNHHGIMDQTRTYHDSEEVVTDAEGRFVIASRWYWSIFVFTQRPEIYVFKSGYGEWRIQDYGEYTKEKYKYAMERDAARLTGEGAVLELPRLKTQEERLQMLSHSPLLVPGVRWPKYLDALNRERISLGLRPINPK